MAHKKNIKSIIFKIIACKDPERFYRQYIEPEELIQKEQQQIIIDAVLKEEDIKIQMLEVQEGAEKQEKNVENNMDETQVSPTAVYLEDKNNITKT